MKDKNKQKKHNGEENNKIEELENQNKRLLADYQNLEKRVENQKGEWILSANKDLLLNLLPVLDTLILADKHTQGKDQALSVSLKQFLDILQKEGVKRIEAVGKDFDPHMMEAVEVVDGEDGKVIEEVRAGFMLYDKILRPSEVKVGSSKEEQKEEEIKN